MPATLPTRPDALLFDVDGTLVDTMPIHFRAWSAALAAAGLDFVDYPAFQALGGTTATDLVERLAAAQGKAPDVAAILRDKAARVLATTQETAPIAAAVRLALDFHASGGPVALVTGGSHEAIDRALRLHALDTLADGVVITPAELPPGRGKPHPDGILLACAQLGVEPTRCAYVGDSPLDRAAAGAAGLAFLDVVDLDPDRDPWPAPAEA